MVESIEWLRVLLIDHQTLKYLILFLGAAFGGELGIIALSFLLAQGFFSVVPFCITCFFGTLSSDILYFLIGRSSMANKFFTHRYTSDTVNMITEAVRKISKGSHFLALLLANFMLASRIILIMYVSKTNLRLSRFVFYASIALVLWLMVLIPIGYFSGIGFTYISRILENIYAGIGFLLLVLIVIIVLQLWLKKIFAREGSEIIADKKIEP
jgi:membrane protein DedA with SNARE-associated domain